MSILATSLSHVRPYRLAIVAAALAMLSACSSDLVEYSYPERRGPEQAPDSVVDSNTKPERGLFGGSELTLFGKSRDKPDPGSTSGGVAVNSYLWRASLDTISFMPLSSADPFGGVIITDWYTPPETPKERFKMNVYILGRQLRADGVRVAVFRQSRDDVGQWSDVTVNAKTNTNLENQILTRARQLRIATASN